MYNFIKWAPYVQADKNNLHFFLQNNIISAEKNLSKNIGKFMAKDDVIIFSGVVEDKLPNTMFRVKLENGHEILATVCGKMRKARIWVNVGEHVRVEMTPYDLDKGRITFVERTRSAGDTATESN